MSHCSRQQVFSCFYLSICSCNLRPCYHLELSYYCENFFHLRIVCVAATHQWGLTQQFASSDQVADGDVEVGVPTAPVGDLGEGMGGQDVLNKHTHRWTLQLASGTLTDRLGCLLKCLMHVRRWMCLLIHVYTVKSKLTIKNTSDRWGGEQ